MSDKITKTIIYEDYPFNSVNVNTAGAGGYYGRVTEITNKTGYEPFSAVWCNDFNTGIYPVLSYITTNTPVLSLNSASAVTGVSGTIRVFFRKK